MSTPAGGRSAAPDRRGHFDWLTVGAAVVSFLITVNLVLQNVSSGDSDIRPSAQSIANYWVVAGLLIAMQVGLLVRAILRGRGVLVVISIVALVFAVGASLISSVPRIEGPPAPPAHTLDPNYTPCFSGSGDCVGG